MNQKSPLHWYDPLRSRPSLGSATPKASSMAGLHAARLAHWGQFWTPDAVASLMWRIASAAMDRPVDGDRARQKVCVLDNAIGSGRLVQFADPERHVIAGVDVDGETLDALGAALASAGFTYDLLNARLEEVSPSGFDVAVINPPFSLHLESALLEPYACTTHGRFGPNASALSHLYALHQALDAAQVVVALLPRSAVVYARSEPSVSCRLRAVIDLPADAFVCEGARVETSILVFGDEGDGEVRCLTYQQCSEQLPDFGLRLRGDGARWPRELRRRTVDDQGPAITTPVTGDARVRVYRDRRAIGLSFACGLTEAKVLNAIHRERLSSVDVGDHRYPAGVETIGCGLLDLEVHLCQPDPAASIATVARVIEAAGGVPLVDRQLTAYVARRIRRDRVDRTPLRHTVFVPKGQDVKAAIGDSGEVVAVARRSHLMHADRWGSPMIKQGARLRFTVSQSPEGQRFTFESGTHALSLTRAELLERFEVEQAQAGSDGWVVVHEGRGAAFPQKAAAMRARASRLRLDRFMSWGYQLDDLIELSMHDGVICGWYMGLGKARLAIALCLMGEGRRNLLVVQANLIPELLKELAKLQLDPSLWQVIDRPEALKSLRCINVISYTRLRMAVPGTRKKTYGKALRSRICTLVADEGDCISNESQQVAALYAVNAKRRYALSGTPIGNYPRDLLPLAIWAKGDGNARQPYGRRRPFIEAALASSMVGARRGVDVFRERFVTVDWYTYSWAETMSDGAKREIPALSSIDLFREFVSTLVLRRVWDEPEVSRYIRVPEPIETVESVPWDEGHLAHYLQIAEEFAHWWREERRRAGEDGRRLNLVAVLAKLGAVFQAATFPQGAKGPGLGYHRLTSKHRRAIDLLADNAQQGRKTLLFASSPDLCALLSSRLVAQGVHVVTHTGKQTIKQRNRAMDAFRDGDASAMLATFGVTQKGHNIPQASDVVYLNRLWTPRQEHQALYRALRPQQTNRLRVTYLHLAGSLDLYMARMVAMKADAAAAGLDWGTPEYSTADFVHWLSVLDAFCEELSALKGVERRDLREALSHAA